MRYAILLALAAIVSGCASFGGQYAGPVVDSEKVARIENAARAVGVQVYWVNYPTRAAASVN